MIIAERKPFEEIMNLLEPYKKVLTVGCGTCVAACPSSTINGAHFTNDQVLSEIEGILWDVRERQAVPA